MHFDDDKRSLRMSSGDLSLVTALDGSANLERASDHGSELLNATILPFLLGGIVMEGDHRGRELGYPTANVAVVRWDAAPEGVFAGTVRRADGSLYRSAISVGRRETFYDLGAPILVEAFLLDFAGDLYGEYLRVELTRELRQQRRFTSIEELIQEIENDVAEVRKTVNLGARHNGRHTPGLGVRKDLPSGELTNEA